MDANTQVSDSEVMTQTLFANEFFDLSGPAGRQDCTYCANGWGKVGNCSEGTSRIDFLFANTAAFPAVSSAR